MVQREARAVFSEGLVGLCFISGNKAKGIKQVAVRDISGHLQPPSLLF